MPRPTVLDGRSRRLAPVPGAGREARRRTDGSNRRRPPAESGRRAETRSSPSMQAPRSPATRVGIKRRLLEKGAARAGSLGQDMAGRDAREAPRVRRPIRRSAPSRLRKRRAEPKRKPKNDHRGSHRAADPGALFSRIGRACARAFVTILLRRGTTRPGPPSKRSATRAGTPRSTGAVRPTRRGRRAPASTIAATSGMGDRH